MKVRRATLDECAAIEGAVVVIDVLRSFTTAAVAFARGASRIIAVPSVEAARRAAARHPGALTLGAYPGGAPIADFDLPNSPARVAAADVAGRTIVLLTAGGVRGLVAARRASVVLAGDKLICVSRLGGAYVLAAKPEFAQLAHNEFESDGSDFNASPAISDGQLFLRSNRYLYCVETE